MCPTNSPHPLKQSYIILSYSMHTLTYTLAYIHRCTPPFRKLPLHYIHLHELLIHTFQYYVHSYIHTSQLFIHSCYPQIYQLLSLPPSLDEGTIPQINHLNLTHRKNKILRSFSILRAIHHLIFKPPP